MALNDGLVNIALNRDHGFVFLAASGIALHAQLSAMGVGKARAKTFGSDEFKNRNLVKSLTEEHKKATGDEELPKGGHPDMGNGRYSEALTYGEWFELNNNQRVHQNYVEHLPSVETYLLLGGLHYPKTAASTAAIFMLGRLMYAHGYRKHGPKGRKHGFIVSELATLVLAGLAVCSAGKTLGWCDYFSGGSSSPSSRM